MFFKVARVGLSMVVIYLMWQNMQMCCSFAAYWSKQIRRGEL